MKYWNFVGMLPFLVLLIIYSCVKYRLTFLQSILVLVIFFSQTEHFQETVAFVENIKSYSLFLIRHQFIKVDTFSFVYFFGNEPV